MESQQNQQEKIPSPTNKEDTNNSSNSSNNSFTTIGNNTTILEDQTKQSTFKDKINDPKSQNIKDNMLLFIREVQGGSKFKDEELPDLVRNKINDIEKSFQKLWQENKQIETENGEVIEAVIIKALYNKLISLFDKRFDNKMHLNLKIYEFINLRHFDVDQKCVENNNFKKSLQYIARIDTLKSPKDKLQSICYACKYISQMLAQQNTSSPIGADQFLPILVFAVLQGKPQNPISNLEFIREFRMGHRLKGVEEYYFTAYQSALEFIEEIDETKLNIEKQEFKEIYKKQFNKYKDDFQIIQDKQINHTKIKQITKEECLENLFQLKTHIYDLHENFNIERKDKLKYINKPYSQIQIGELQQFFNEYHLLAKHYVDMQQKVNNLTQITDTLLENKQPKKQRFLGNWF